jgi:hypothetical protein
MKVLSVSQKSTMPSSIPSNILWVDYIVDLYHDICAGTNTDYVYKEEQRLKEYEEMKVLSVSQKSTMPSSIPSNIQEKSLV